MQMMIVVQLLWFDLAWMFAPSKLLPTMSQVAVAMRDLLAGGMFGELLNSLKTNVVAVLVASVFSLSLSYLTCIPFVRPLATGFSFLRYLSLAGITLGFTLLLGGSYWLKIAVLAFAVSVFFVRSMVDVIRRIPSEQYDLARTLRYSEVQVVGEVVILGTAADAFDIIRQNAAMSWMMLPFAESLVWSQGGIGVMLLDSSKHFRLESIVAIQLTILGCGLVQDYGIGVIRKFLCPAADLAVREGR
jgi:ABC-type nitrate/sulfonate/bicarbonate transport system permease component